jgi:DNA-binding PadR family transcriptional regulator
MSERTDLHEYLPLRPIEFEILLVLVGGDSHGYAIIKEAETRWPGSGPLETGTLYRAIRRLVASDMIRPADRRPTTEVRDERRRYFTVTALGKAVAAAEARRLAAQIRVATARELLPEVTRGAR